MSKDLFPIMTAFFFLMVGTFWGKTTSDVDLFSLIYVIFIAFLLLLLPLSSLSFCWVYHFYNNHYFNCHPSLLLLISLPLTFIFPLTLKSTGGFTLTPPISLTAFLKMHILQREWSSVILWHKIIRCYIFSETFIKYHQVVQIRW